jgi:hypothetical protein
MKCKECGFTNPDGAKICQNCAEPLPVGPDRVGLPAAAQSPAARGTISAPPPPPPLPRTLRPGPPVQPQASRPAEKQPKPGSGVRGIVSGFQERTEPIRHGLVWTFRIDQYDEAGNLVERIPVEMRGLGFNGMIRDGETISVSGRWRPGGILRPKRVLNETTRSTVSSRGYGPLVALLFLAFFIFFGVLAYTGITQSRDAFNSFKATESAMFGSPAVQNPVTIPLPGFGPCDQYTRQIDFQKRVLAQHTDAANAAADAAGRNFWNQFIQSDNQALQQAQRDLEQCRQQHPGQ